MLDEAEPSQPLLCIGLFTYYSFTNNIVVCTQQYNYEPKPAVIIEKYHTLQMTGFEAPALFLSVGLPHHSATSRATVGSLQIALSSIGQCYSMESLDPVHSSGYWHCVQF